MASQVEARPPPPPSQPPMLLPSPSNTSMQQQAIPDSKPAQSMKSEIPQLNGNMGILKQELFTEEDLIKDEAFITDEFLEMSPITPSPPAEGTIMNNSAPTTTKSRPPRKSTLTQQQKNQKRQRATTDQLQTLEIEFNKNPTPTANVRERIAAEINMTERSVQIWFQNRRAKIKNLAKKSIETGEDCDAIPESMKKYLAMQAMESGKPFLREAMGNNGMFSPYGNGLLLNADNNPSKTVITHFSCNSLTIGSWRRIGTAALDLVVFYSPAKSIITYYINADASGYKIEYPFSYIKNITLDSGDLSASAEGANQPSGGLIVELSRPPHFQMDHSKTGFYPARDFTEDQQASQVLVHHLGGHPKVLSGQLAKLVSLDSFRNRHRQPDAANMASSAPVSPIGMRPASQPNHLVHPHIAQPAPTPQSLYPVAPPQPFEMGPPLPRGHKRQRSRSVPIAMDFSQMRQQPVPHFQIPQFSFQHTHPSMQPMLQAPAHLSPMPLGPQVHQPQQTLAPPPAQTMSQQPQPSLQHYHQLTPPRQQAPQQQSQQPQQLRQQMQPQSSPQPLPPQQQNQQAHAPSTTPQPLTPQPSTPGANGQTQIYAPVPQHHHQGFGPVGPTLRIDISSGYSFDFRHAHPMSATPGAQTTATTDSDTPIFSAAVSQEPFSAPPHQSTFPGGPFLSPQVDPSHLAVSAAPSPLSTVSHSNEPFIVNQSPPMTGFDRSPASNDTYPTPDETTQENYIDPNAGLADPWGEYDLFSKQHFSLPFRATGEMTPKEEFDFQDMIDFNEPLSLSPDTSFVTNHDTADPISTNRPQST